MSYYLFFVTLKSSLTLKNHVELLKSIYLKSLTAFFESFATVEFEPIFPQA